MNSKDESLNEQLFKVTNMDIYYDIMQITYHFQFS